MDLDISPLFIRFLLKPSVGDWFALAEVIMMNLH
jgi:hypothetical protein